MKLVQISLRLVALTGVVIFHSVGIKNPRTSVIAAEPAKILTIRELSPTVTFPQTTDINSGCIEINMTCPIDFS